MQKHVLLWKCIDVEYKRTTFNLVPLGCFCSAFAFEYFFVYTYKHRHVQMCLFFSGWLCEFIFNYNHLSILGFGVHVVFADKRGTQDECRAMIGSTWACSENLTFSTSCLFLVLCCIFSSVQWYKDRETSLSIYHACVRVETKNGAVCFCFYFRLRGQHVGSIQMEVSGQVTSQGLVVPLPCLLLLIPSPCPQPEIPLIPLGQGQGKPLRKRPSGRR